MAVGPGIRRYGTVASLVLLAWDVYCMWITLRRNYQFWPTVIGTLGAFCVADL